uniref:Integrase catalytic domain-containing protein n=1 Tax=Tanacetum cinerariifolium TaxID=118510 RepID=A0A6L2JXG4_TANCI|nr:hypothetical protein [Tanacetum cinerariifolium]
MSASVHKREKCGSNSALLTLESMSIFYNVVQPPDDVISLLFPLLKMLTQAFPTELLICDIFPLICSRPHGHSNPWQLQFTGQTSNYFCAFLLGRLKPDKLPFLEQLIPTLPVPPAGQANPLDVVTTHQAWVKAHKEINGLMLMTMDPDIQKNLEHLGAYNMLKELKTFLILVSLRKEYDGFVQNYNMHSMGKTSMKDLKNQKKKSHKAAKGNQGKGRAKMGNALVPAPSYAPKPKNPPTPKKDNPAKDAICYQCGEVCHWRRNYPIYVAELIKKRSYLKELALQGLRGIRKLKRGALNLYDGFANRFKNDNSISVSKNNLIYFNDILRDDIYEIVMSSSSINDSSMFFVCNKRAKLNLDSALFWHCRVRHINKKRIEKLQQDGLLDLTDIKSFEKHVTCMSGKMARKPYSHQVERAKDLLGLIHTDEVENQREKTIKSLHFDRRGEYVSQEFLDHLKDHEIIAHRTPPYTPQHNGVLERRNRTLLDMVRSMMSQTTLLKSFWDYAIESTTCILNMVPTKKGYEVLVKCDTLTKPNKLEPRAFKCIFVGYSNEMIGYSFYYPPENKVFVTWNADFFENDVIDHEAKIDEPQSDTNLIHRSIRTRRAPDRLCLYIDAEEHELGDLGEPVNYKVALLDPKSDKWLNAMNVEMQSMKHNEVWELVDLPPNRKSVDIRAIRILIAIAAFYDYEIWKIDVKTTFLNGYLNKEAVWIRKFIFGHGVVPTIEEPINMYCDNTKAIAITKDHRVTKGARHFRAKVHYLQETIEMGDVKIEKVDTDDNLADPFIKALAFSKHSELTEKIGMIPTSSLM